MFFESRPFYELILLCFLCSCELYCPRPMLDEDCRNSRHFKWLKNILRIWPRSSASHPLKLLWKNDLFSFSLHSMGIFFFADPQWTLFSTSVSFKIRFFAAISPTGFDHPLRNSLAHYRTFFQRNKRFLSVANRIYVACYSWISACEIVILVVVEGKKRLIE